MSGLLRKCNARVIAVFVLLCLPMVGWTQSTIKEAAKAAKISPDLYQVMQSRGQAAPAVVDGFLIETNQVFADGKVAIEAVANDEDGEGLLNQLRALGLTNGVAYKRMVFGYLPIDKLGELKNVSSLSFARSHYKPETNTGSVTSQGDAALKANVARTTYSVTGAGVKVGILSDSYGNIPGGAAAGVASGDLPAAGVQVLLDLPSGGSDEGRAMAEIVHDVAPGAAIAFNTAFTGEAGFAQGIIDLATAGCQVIVDDIIYFAEPFFQDGIVAQAVDQVVNNNGVTYFSSAGNRVRASYQAPYKNGGTYTNAALYGAGTGPLPTHDFGTGDNLQNIIIPNGQRLRLSFQWDNPFQSVSGGVGATTDLDILVLNSTTGAVLSSAGTVNQSGGGDPAEITGSLSNNTGAPLSVNVIIVKRSGPDPGLIKWVNFGGNNIIPEYDTKSGASFGHNSSEKCISVGAAGYFATPVFNGAATATIEPFSSAGGKPILFTTAGIRINGIIGTVRQKPEITAVDGGDNTFFGNDYEGNGKPNFFGTSAAAPHAAGVAALMKQKVPAITRNTILSTLQSTALDMDDPFTAGFDTGFDFGTGFGFIQADKALKLLTNPTVANVIAPQSATVNLAFSFTIPANTFSDPNGDALTISVTGLPAGLSASGSVISGTPSMSGVSTVTVKATDPGSLSVSTTFQLTVNPAMVMPPANTAPTVANTIAPQSATVNQAFSFTIPTNTFTDAETPSGLTVSVSGLPAGLLFAGGIISGTPSTSGVSTVTVTATDPGSLSVSTTFQLTVNPAMVVMPPAGPFSITGVTTVSCTTLSAGQRQISFTPLYAGTTGQPITFRVVNEMLPTTAPGPYTLNPYTDNPVFTLKATQSGTAGEASFTYNWLAACGTTPVMPPAGPFSITGVTTVSCTTLSAGQRQISFTPLYAGTTGQPISFSVVNELLPTTAPGPYTLNPYIDNPVFTLKATQSGTAGEASFSYNWLAACNGGARLGALPGREFAVPLTVSLYPNPVGEEFTIGIQGAQGQTVRIMLTDLNGRSLTNTLVDVTTADQREQLRFGNQRSGLYLLRVSTAQQAVTLKVIKQ